MIRFVSFLKDHRSRTMTRQGRRRVESEVYVYGQVKFLNFEFRLASPNL